MKKKNTRKSATPAELPVPITEFPEETTPELGHAVSLAATENAIEIAMNCLEFLQERINLGRDAIVRNYIIPWAREAETAWKALRASDNPTIADTPYYDFIDAFSQNKQAEFLQGQLP